MSVFVCNLIFYTILCFFSSVLPLFQNSSNSNNNSKGKDNAERSSASINNCIRCTHSLSFSRTFYLRAFIVVFPSSLSQSTLTGSVILDLSGALPCAAFPLLRRALFHVVVVITQSEQVLVAFLQLLFRSVDDVAPPTRPFFQARRQAGSINNTYNNINMDNDSVPVFVALLFYVPCSFLLF